MRGDKALEQEIERLRNEIEEWKRRYKNWRAGFGRAVEERNQLAEQVEKLNEELARVRKESDRLVHKLVDKITELASRDINPAEDNIRLVEALGDAFAKSFVGYGMPVNTQATPDNPESPTHMYEQTKEEVFIPDHELDDELFPGILDNEVLPARGGFWSPHSPPQPDLDHPPGHEIIGNQVRRTDGTPMFAAGQSAPKPKGGIE